jgi:hypothetical protein
MQVKLCDKYSQDSYYNIPHSHKIADKLPFILVSHKKVVLPHFIFTSHKKVVLSHFLKKCVLALPFFKR